MYELANLDLQTADGRPLIHKFYRQSEAAAGLLIVFPGNHYGVDGPLLYYPCELLRDQGWDTLAVSYGFQTAGKGPFEDGLDVLLAECKSAAQAALNIRDYPRLGLVGKSLGAAVVAHLCANEPGFSEARAGYLTPALGTPFFDPLFLDTRQSAFVAVGTEGINRERVQGSRGVAHFFSRRHLIRGISALLKTGPRVVSHPIPATV